MLPSAPPMLRRSASVLAALLLAGAAPKDRDPPRAGAETSAPAEPGAAAVATVPPPRPAGTSWFALPVLFWMPETRLGFGAASGLHFHLRGAERASSIFLVGAYTLNHQGSADLAADMNLRGGYLVSGRFRATYFPDAFYGIGPRTPTSARETYTRRWSEATVSAEAPVFQQKLRVGVRSDLRAEEMRDLTPGGLLASGAVQGVDGFIAVGLGGSVTWDTRDLPIYPGRGTFAQAEYLRYLGTLGRGADFSRLIVEGRTFLPLGAERVLAFAGFVEQAVGDVPFTLLPKLGSPSYLRGWRDGRFRDHVAWAAQSELRAPLWKRLSGAVFAALGDVAPSLGDVGETWPRFAGGVGLRYRLTPEGANIRLDLAESAAGPEVYVLLLEAF